MPGRSREYIALFDGVTGNEIEEEEASSHGKAIRGRRKRRGCPTIRELVTGRTLVAALCTFVLLVIVHRLLALHIYRGPAPDPYFHTGDPKSHNAQTLARLERCRSLELLQDTATPRLDPLLGDEEARREAVGCGTNHTTLVILSSLFFSEAFVGTNTAGEAIYAQSVISTLNYWGYSYVFTSLGWWNNDMRYTTEIWEEWKDITRTILADPEQVDECWHRNGTGQCLKSEENPEGIPAWKLLSFWYWDE